MDEFSIRIKKLREEKGYSFKDLELLTGISRSTLQRYEANGAGNMPISKIKAVAKAFDVSNAYLMGWESREIGFSEYETIEELLSDLDLTIVYHSSTEDFTLNNSKTGEVVCKLKSNDIRGLVEKTKSYFNFELQQLIQKNAGL